MPDGKHCPECGRDVGYRAVALGLFRIRCPHCWTRLRYAYSPRMSAATTAAALGSVVAAFAAGGLAGWAVLRHGGPVLAVAGVALGVCVAGAFALGLVCEVALAPVLRRTQALVREDAPKESPDDADW